MALSDPYATAAEYRAAVKPDADGGADASITTDLTAISRYLEGKLGRFFNQDAVDTTSVYVAATGADTLEVDDFAAAPTSVAVDDGSGAFATTLAPSDYELQPANALLLPEPAPYTRIALVPWGTAWSRSARVRVVGRRGWPAVPAGIKSGTIQLTAVYRLESPRATRRIDEVGDTIETSPGAQRILWELVGQYAKRWGVV